MNACRPLRMPPVPKNVLMALADRASDDGMAWPSIAGICEATCFGRSAVIDAVKWLEQAGFVEVQRAEGRTNRMRIRLETLPDQSASRTGPPDEPVHVADPTSPPAGRVPVHVADQPVRVADPNHQEPPSEPSGNHQESARKAPRATSPETLLPEVTPQALSDWQAVRKAKRAGPITATVAAAMRREAQAAGISLQQAVEHCCARGWQGFKAAWLDSGSRSGEPAFVVQRRERIRDMTGGLFGDGPLSFRERDALLAQRTADAWMGSLAPNRSAPQQQGDVFDLDDAAPPRLEGKTP